MKEPIRFTFQIDPETKNCIQVGAFTRKTRKADKKVPMAGVVFGVEVTPEIKDLDEMIHELIIARTELHSMMAEKELKGWKNV